MAIPMLLENDLAQIVAVVNGVQVRVDTLDSFEALSELSECTIEITGPGTTPLVMRDVIGTEGSVGIRSRVSNSDPWETRFIHGVVSRLTYLGQITDPSAQGTKSRYRLSIVPGLWFLTQNRRCRIFQSQSIPEIVFSVLGEHDIAAVWASGQPRGVYPSPEFCVQYNESDFSFISRLMEEYGIFYYFRHSAEEGQMVLADDIRDYYYWNNNTAAVSNLRFGNAGSGSTGDHIQQWIHDCEFRPHSYAHGDFNDQEASTDLRRLARNSILAFQNSPGDLEVYEYPGGFTHRSGEGRHFEDLTQGENLADRRIQEQEAAQEVIHGGGVSPSFFPGGKFTLVQHPVAAENSVYVVRSVRLTSRLASGQTMSAGTAVLSQFDCLPATVCFRAPRTTPRPIVRGPQTAVVTNSDGSMQNTADEGSLADTNTDAAGRVRVRFHWDQTTSATSSCWVRVSQSWAGPGYGSLMLPYVGHEVVVSFLEGDPDRPLITGRVYNSQNLPPREEDEVAVNPHRVVVAQDEVGNTIILDGDEGRVDIQNASDKFELTVGTSATATAGMDFAVTLGCGIGINLGAACSAELAASYSLQFGWSTSVFFGGTCSASIGGDFTWAKGSYVNAGDSLGQISFGGPADFVSKASASLAGGSGANNSVVNCSSDGATITFGPTDPTMLVDTNVGRALLLTSLLGSIGAASAGATAFLGATASDKEEFDGHAAGAVATGVASVAASVAAAFLLRKYAKVWGALKQPVHASPTSRIKVDAQGINVASFQKLQQLGGTAIENVSASLFKVCAPQSTISGNLTVNGVFSSTNIKDLGDPSAAAAAISAAQAAIAQLQAAAAAAAAAEIAQRTAAQAAAAAQEASLVPV